MLDLADLSRARCVVEFGAGTGACTREILQRLGSDGQVLAFEVDPTFAHMLDERFDDRRLRIVNDSAENVEGYLHGTKADVIVSALPFTSLPTTLRQNVLGVVGTVLAPQGVMLVLQYSTILQRELERSFESVSRRVSLLNLPPAFLFACRSPVT
ncbi:MAG: methyltransferase domain-containing protein [Actinomycetota bacterium]|nr:methyltransferase domain-containing protein [Actinomycetota bacterium]